MQIEILNYIIHLWNVATAMGTLAHVSHIENSVPVLVDSSVLTRQSGPQRFSNSIKNALCIWHTLAHLSLFLAFIYSNSLEKSSHHETHKAAIKSLFHTANLYTNYYPIFSFMFIYLPLVSLDTYTTWSKTAIQTTLYKNYKSLVKFILFLNPVRDWTIIESVIYIENKQLQKKTKENAWIHNRFSKFMKNVKIPNIHTFRNNLQKLDPAIITPILGYKHKDYLDFLSNYWSKELAECYKDNYHTTKKELQQLYKQLPLALFNKPLTLCIKNQKTDVVKKLVIPASISDQIKSFLCLIDLQCLADPFLTQSTVAPYSLHPKENPKTNLFNTQAIPKESSTTSIRYPKPRKRRHHAPK